MPRRALLPTLRQSLGFGLALPELSGHRTEVPNICATFENRSFLLRQVTVIVAGCAC
jgi:hypothetical protein